jgi:hypothetical protein
VQKGRAAEFGALPVLLVEQVGESGRGLPAFREVDVGCQVVQELMDDGRGFARTVAVSGPKPRVFARIAWGAGYTWHTCVPQPPSRVWLRVARLTVTQVVRHLQLMIRSWTSWLSARASGSRIVLDG